MVQQAPSTAGAAKTHMSSGTIRWAENAVGTVMFAALAWLVWGWWSFSGLYRLLAHLELAIFGSFGAISTFALGVVFICGLAGLAFRPLFRLRGQSRPVQAPSAAAIKASTERAAMTLAMSGGALSLAVTLAAGGLLLRDARRDAASAVLDLSSSRTLPAGAGHVRLVGFTKRDLLVEVDRKQTPGVGVTSTAYMAVVGPDWRPGRPVPVIVQGSPRLGLSSMGQAVPRRDALLPFDLPSGYVRSWTSGFAADLLAGRGAAVDGNTLILDTEQEAERDVLLPVVLLGGLLAAFGIGGGLVLRHSNRVTGATSSTAPSPPSFDVRQPPVTLRVREINHGASGGSYHCVFEATVRLQQSAGVTVTVQSTETVGAAPDLVDEARNAIRDGAADALSPMGIGAAIDVTRLLIHDIDFKPWRFRSFTARDLRRALSERGLAS